jgi:outer membrane protein
MQRQKMKLLISMTGGRMKRFCFMVGFAAVVTLAAGSAFADNIAGRFGVTGRVGFLVPADSETTFPPPTLNLATDVGFVGGGGFIYGIDRNIAAELEVTHAGFDASIGGIKQGNFETNDISLGVLYRFREPVPRLTPFAGGGLNILVNNFTFDDGVKTDVDTVAGVHLTGGVDYFVDRNLALTSALKAVLAPDADISVNGRKIGNFDPMSFSMTFGMRYFFK